MLNIQIMKKTYYLLFFFTTIIQSQIINFPDANLKARLLAADTNNSIAQIFVDEAYSNVKIDLNNNSEIEVSEALVILSLDINSEGMPEKIANLSGLEFFLNLRVLNCNFNEITNLDLTFFSNIYDVSCTHNLITGISFPELEFLNTLFCSYNLISEIDFTAVGFFETLYIDHNQLTNFNGASQLFAGLDCSYNNLTSVDFTNAYVSGLQIHNNPALETFLGHGMYLDHYLALYDMPNLQTIDISSSELVYLFLENLSMLQNINVEGATVLFFSATNTPLAHVDFPEISVLKEVVINNTQIDVADFSQAIYIEKVDIKNNPNLTRINLKNGSIESPIIIQNNQNLSYLCVDDSQIDSVFSIVGALVNINSYCSFQPGGNYNSISGNIVFDSDSNGCDASDARLSSVKLNISDGINQGSTFTKFNGSYEFYTQGGDFTITPAIENQPWFNFSPPTATIPFADNNNNTITQDFCIAPNGFHPDIEVIVLPLTNARPGFDATYKIVFKNKGNYTYTEGIIGFQFDDTVLDFVSASEIPFTQAAGQINWNFTNLMPFESRSIEVTLNVNGPMETPPVNIDDQLNFTATTFPLEVDETSFDNTFTYQQTVVGSFDPNDKTCLEGSLITSEMIGNYLHYSINFENTGTAPAQKIVVKDIIDTTKFDISTLQIINMSHQSITKITSNRVEFMFDNINLAPAAHGNVVFKIKTKSNLSVGSTVSNKAEIFFDYNFPIVTNTATSTFQLLSNTVFEADDSVVMYPNPASQLVSVTANSMIKSIQTYDVQGRIINTYLVNDTKTNLDVSNYSNGIYFMKVFTDRGLKIEKIVKE